jgi:hypothetical protein
MPRRTVGDDADINIGGGTAARTDGEDGTRATTIASRKDEGASGRSNGRDRRRRYGVSGGGDGGRNEYAKNRDVPSSSAMERDGNDVEDEGYHDDIGPRTYDEFDRRDDDGYDRIPSFEWEMHRSTSILFPPRDEEEDGNRGRRGGGRRRRPMAIVHFVGGTLFGSYPRRFYGSLLEDISIKCDAVVIATPIPIVLPGVRGLADRVERWMFNGQERGGGYDDDDGRRGPKGGRRGRYDGRENVTSANPLDHASLAARVQTDFNSAYRDVILDEYCADCIDDIDYDDEVEDFMRRVPIVGIGHSLGARIQAVSCSDPYISKRYLSMGKRKRLIRSGRDGMVYLGFANWGAKSSIPGVETLDDTVRKRKMAGRGDGVGRRDDVWDNGSRRRRRDSYYNYNTRGRYDRYDGYDAEDLDLMDVFGDVISGVANGVKKIGEALTPEAEDLEFSPTPNNLWDDLSSSTGSYSRSCRNNLIVQFEDDPIDQGSRLARTLLMAYEADVNATSSAENDAPQVEAQHGVKFARLSGGHLTPVTLRGDIAKLIPRRALSLLSSSYNFVLEQIDGRTIKSSQKQRKDVEDVADTVASYIRSLNGDM